MPAIAAQLKTIAAVEQIEIGDAALALIARAAEGSMRDAQSALDQVIAFAGSSIAVDDVSTVLGLVGRDLLFDLINAVVAEDGPRAFALADRAVESGHDLKLVCRELSRVVRDVMLVSVDPNRAGDGELAEGERERLAELATRFSREDLMRAFDLLEKAEQEIRNTSQPRYYFEMVLLRWMHLRKLVPLTALLEELGSGKAPARMTAPPPRPVVTPKAAAAPARPTIAVAPPKPSIAPPVAPPLAAKPAPATRVATTPPAAAAAADVTAGKAAAALAAAGKPPANLKDALLAEIRRGKQLLYELAIAQARRIDVDDQRIAFTFASNQSVARTQLEQNRAWVEAAAERIAGTKIPVVVLQAEGAPVTEPPTPAATTAAADDRDLKAEALSTSAVQAMLDVFPAEIRDVEEM
jgi:DNA polymerase-3 subunit gamma/tau